MFQQKLLKYCGEGIESRFSHPSGKPASEEGNFMVWILILWPLSLDFFIDLEIQGSLRSVVIIVALTPFLANILAMSTIGIR